MNPLALGRVRVEAVVETAGPTRPTWLFPAATPEALEPHRAWLAPHFIDAEGRLRQSVHTFVVKTPDLTVLVDTCIGNDKDRGGRRPFHMLRTAFLEELRAAGVDPDAVDVVICTHLHVDHVGWNTRLAGRPLGADLPPRPLPVRRGESGSTGRPRRRTAPSESGRARTPGTGRGPGRLGGRRTIGHGRDPARADPRAHPGSRERAPRLRWADALITGDLTHHPVQWAEPAWQSAFDTDPVQARETRRAFCARYADRPVSVLGTHFHHPTAGRIVEPPGRMALRGGASRASPCPDPLDNAGRRRVVNNGSNSKTMPTHYRGRPQERRRPSTPTSS